MNELMKNNSLRQYVGRLKGCHVEDVQHSIIRGSGREFTPFVYHKISASLTIVVDNPREFWNDEADKFMEMLRQDHFDIERKMSCHEFEPERIVISKSVKRV